MTKRKSRSQAMAFEIMRYGGIRTNHNHELLEIFIGTEKQATNYVMKLRTERRDPDIYHSQPIPFTDKRPRKGVLLTTEYPYGPYR